MPDVIISNLHIPSVMPIDKASVISGLLQSVSNSYSILALAHTAHINVVGCNFSELHGLFGDIYEGALENADLFAERIKAISFDTSVVIDLATIPALSGMPKFFPAYDGATIIPILISALEKDVGDLSKLIVISGQANDLVTQNMVMGVVESEQKTIWKLKAQMPK